MCMNGDCGGTADEDRDGSSGLFEWRGKAAYYRGLPTERRVVQVGDRIYELYALEDAADLLDEPDFAAHFLEEDRAPYGLELWPAATMLAEYLQSGDPGAGRTAIELGCGVGLVAMAATDAGWRVLATDHEPTSLRFARYNAEVNAAGVEAWELLDWNAPPEGRRFDLVLAADVLYQTIDHAPLLRCFERLLAPGGTVLVADPRRRLADGFAAKAEAAGFTVEILPTEAPGSQGRTVRGRIFRMKRI